MPVLRTYTYIIERCDDPMKLTDGLVKAGELVHKHNKWVEDVAVRFDPESHDITIKLTMKGHDQWWIKKRVIYPLAALLTKTGLTLKDARLAAVDRPGDLRSTRLRASDGRSNPLPEDEMVDHADMGLVG